MPHFATGTFQVSLKPLPAEHTGAGSKLARMSIDKQISGDLVATTVGQMLAFSSDTTGSAGYVAMEQVTGALHGRAGSFVLQHSATMNRGEPSLSIRVVPDSGAGELVGLAGDFTIEVVAGTHRYEFNYHLDGNQAASAGT